MKKIISILLALLLLTQSSALAFAQTRTNYVEEYPDRVDGHHAMPRIVDFCKYSHNKDICDLHYKYGVKKAEAWDNYYYAYVTPDLTDYWSETPMDLYKKYGAVADEIGFLWNKNPEYINARVVSILRKLLITMASVWTAVIIGAAVGPVLTQAGFPIAGSFAQIIPTGTGASAGVASKAVGFSIKGILNSLITKVTTARFWGDIGLTLVVMAADAALVEGTIWTFYTLDAELQLIQSETATGKKVIKTRHLLQEMMGYNLTQEQKDEVNNEEKEIEKLSADLKSKFEEAIREDNTWGDMTNTQAYLLHREAVVTLYALEYLRAELSDLSDKMRYRSGAVDLAAIYLSEDLLKLSDPRETHEMVKEAYNTSEQKKWDEQAAITKDGIIRWENTNYWNGFHKHM